MSIRSTKNKISQIKAELLKSAFTPMPPDQQQQGAPAGGAPAPQGGAAPAAPAPQGGGGVIEQLQAQGIDPNQLMQDPNMLQQVAQQFGAVPNALAQAIQQEMQAMGGGAPAGGGQPAPPQGPPPGGEAAAPSPEVQELYAGVEQLAQALQQMQGENQQLRQHLMNVEGQIQGLASQVDKVMGLIDEPAGVPESAY